MTHDPVRKRAVAFIDGSNTRLAARKAFGEAYAIFNPLALAICVCETHGYKLAGVRFYLGVPDLRVTEDGHYAWMKRCARWRRQGVTVFTRVLRMDEEGIAREKGIDVRLALDAVDQLRRDPFDVALLFSQDQDFSELADELKRIATELNRELEVTSVYPWSERLQPASGIRGTVALPVSKGEFARALDDAQNRKLRLATPGEAAMSEPAEALSDPLPGEDVGLPADRPAAKAARFQTQPVSTVAVKPRPERRSRRVTRALTLLASVYLLCTALTLGTLTWQSRETIFAPIASVDAAKARAVDLARFAARALLWPEVWIQHLSDIKLPDIKLATAIDRIDLSSIETYANDVIGKLNP